MQVQRGRQHSCKQSTIAIEHPPPHAEVLLQIQERRTALRGGSGLSLIGYFRQKKLMSLRQNQAGWSRHARLPDPFGILLQVVQGPIPLEKRAVCSHHGRELGTVRL